MLLVRLSQLVETAVDDLVTLLKTPLSEEEIKKLMPEPDQSQPAPEPDAYTQVLNQFTQRNTEALVRCTRLSLDAIKRRVQMSSRYTGDDDHDDKKPPLFKAEIVLAIPNVVMKVCGCV